MEPHRRSQGRWLFATAVAVAVLAAPFAIAAGEGDPLEGGVRNPSNNQQQALQRETEVIANTSTYGTRQSNKSNNGGGAIYGCRSGEGGTRRGNEPCIRANNLSEGLAFEFETDGDTVGRIDAEGAGGDDKRPFTTNATGVATGLNADRVDGLEGEQLRPVFAQVAANGTSPTERGVVSARRDAEGDYTVVFAGDRTGCAFSATLAGTDSGEITFDAAAAADKQTTVVDVRTFQSNGQQPKDSTFHLVAHC